VPHGVTGVVVFLASPAATLITGTVMLVDAAGRLHEYEDRTPTGRQKSTAETTTRRFPLF